MEKFSKELRGFKLGITKVGITVWGCHRAQWPKGSIEVGEIGGR